jgi:hypothetical protein
MTVQEGVAKLSRFVLVPTPQREAEGLDAFFTGLLQPVATMASRRTRGLPSTPVGACLSQPRFELLVCQWRLSCELSREFDEWRGISLVDDDLAVCHCACEVTIPTEGVLEAGSIARDQCQGKTERNPRIEKHGLVHAVVRRHGGNDLDEPGFWAFAMDPDRARCGLF